MNVESLPVAQARASQRLLAQYLVTCPSCRKSSAAHVDRDGGGTRVLVRFVCPEACPVSDDVVLALLPAEEVQLTA